MKDLLLQQTSQPSQEDVVKTAESAIVQNKNYAASKPPFKREQPLGKNKDLKWYTNNPVVNSVPPG